MKIIYDDDSMSFEFTPENADEQTKLNVLRAECITQPASVLIDKLSKAKVHWEILMLTQQIYDDLTDYTFMILQEEKHRTG